MTNHTWFIGTLLAGFISFSLIRLTAKHTLLYGRRRLILAILIGFIISVLFRQLGGRKVFHIRICPIGFVIPGLLGYWMDKQGILDTLSIMFIASVIIRLVIILIAQGDPNVLAA